MVKRIKTSRSRKRASKKAGLGTGTKWTIRRKNRLITFIKTKRFGKNKNLDRKIVSNEPA